METLVVVIVLALFVGFIAWRVVSSKKNNPETPWTAEEFNDALVLVRTKAQEAGIGLTDEQVTQNAIEYLRSKYNV